MQEGNDPIHTCLLSVKSAMMSTGGFSKGSFIQQNMEVILTFATGMERCVFGQGICVCVFFSAIARNEILLVAISCFIFSILKVSKLRVPHFL